MALTKSQLTQRENKLTASRVACLMTGDKAKILNLWKELVGDPGYVDEDLSDIWAVQLGSATEELNLDWYERRKKVKVTRRGEVVTMLKPTYFAATLDGWDDSRACPIECKNVGGFEKPDVILQRYQPQLQWQMLVTGTSECAFSVIAGAREPVVDYISADRAYIAEMVSRAEKFMECVRDLKPPFEFDPVIAPVVPTKEVDMTGSNQWGNLAAMWLDYKSYAKIYDDAVEQIKLLTPKDAVRAYGHSIEVRRDRAGRLKITEIR